MASFSKKPEASGSAATSTAPSTAAAHARRSSSSRNNATATMRLSLSEIVNTHGKERHEAEKARQENADNTRSQRRRSSLLQMGVANSGIMEAASSVLKQEAASAAETKTDASPIEKLQALLTKAKERGMSAERLFEHFAPDGEESVTPKMFEAALRKLGKQAFDLDELELEHLVAAFDTDGNGTVELDEFMTFCLSIPSLPWRAEKARRLNNAESKDELNVAARKVARRRSSLRAIPIGRLMHQGSIFFWRSKENLDVAFHLNSDEGLVTISTRCLDRGYNYPAIFVDASKIPATKAMAVEKANPTGQLDALTPEKRQEAIDKALDTLRVEYLEQRLKVPDGVNRTELDVEPAESDSTDTSSEEEEEEGKSGERVQRTGAAATATARGATATASGAVGGATAAAASEAGWATNKRVGMTPKERAHDKTLHRPFLAKLSTDTWDTLLCPRNVVLQTPHRFETAAPPASMAEFRRASIEFGKLARETEKLSSVAEGKTQKVEESIDSITATDETR